MGSWKQRISDAAGAGSVAEMADPITIQKSNRQWPVGEGFNRAHTMQQKDMHSELEKNLL